MDEEELRALVRLVRANPEAAAELRRALLDDALLQLPEVVALQGQGLAGLTDRVDALTQRLDALVGQVGALTERVDALAQRVDALVGQVGALTERVDALTQRVDALVGQVGALIDTVGGVVSEQADTAELLGRFVALATAVFERIEARLDRIEERLG